MMNDKPVKNVDYCHRYEDSIYYWAFEYPYPDEASPLSMHQQVASIAQTSWECMNEFIHPTVVNCAGYEFQSDHDIEAIDLTTGKMSQCSVDTWSHTITDADGIDFDQVAAVLNQESRIATKVDCSETLVKVDLASGSSWVGIEPPLENARLDDDGYLRHKTGWPVLKIVISPEGPYHRENYHQTVISTHSDIWLEDTDIGAANRERLTRFFECICERSSPEDVEIGGMLYSVDDLRDRELTELFPEAFCE